MDLSNDRRTLEAEAAIKIRKLETDFKDFNESKETEMGRERHSFEQNVAERNDRSNIAVETRMAELLRSREEKRIEFDKEEKRAAEEQGAAPTEMIQAHRNHINEMEAQAKAEKKKTEDNHADAIRTSRIMFDKGEKMQRDEVARRKQMVYDNIERIRTELAAKIKASESDWQNECGKWLTIGKKKVQVKQREDTETKKIKKKR